MKLKFLIEDVRTVFSNDANGLIDEVYEEWRDFYDFDVNNVKGFYYPSDYDEDEPTINVMYGSIWMSIKPTLEFWRELDKKNNKIETK